MQTVKLEHFERALEDIGAHGDNDMLPFDMDNRFVADNKHELSKIAFQLFSNLEQNRDLMSSFQVFSERLLSPTGANGFRISTKIHTFWNLYLNGLAVAVADANENNRSPSAHSYRFIRTGKSLFDKEKSWRAYKEATLNNPAIKTPTAYVVQTDISGFYEHIYHHRLENCIRDLFGSHSTVSFQIDRILNQMSSGRSFGLPVGGQAARILAELLMTGVDQLLTQNGVVWHRYVDDFTLIASSQEDAYKAISILSNILADYGLSLNKTKTTILKAQHYENFVHAQLFSDEGDAGKLKEIDLYFDPYSDNPEEDYEDLVSTVATLDIQNLLDLEVHKSQPDSFLISQIGRTLKLQTPYVALNLCKTLLAPSNLHSLRGSFSTIIKGVGALRSDENFNLVFSEIDSLLDQVILKSGHLLLPETNCLHFLRIIRFKKNAIRGQYVYQEVFQKTSSMTVKKVCIDCMRHWKDRPFFIQTRNNWNNLNTELQRSFWLASYSFGDEGKHFRRQVKQSLNRQWALGFEDSDSDSEKSVTFSSLYIDWVPQNAIS